MPPRDFAVVISRPIQTGCRKIDPLRASWKVRDVVLSRPLEALQSVNQSVIVDSGKLGMQCNALIPNDCCYKYPYQDPLLRSVILPALNRYVESLPKSSYCPFDGFSSTSDAGFKL